jgi:hypothetical protein
VLPSTASARATAGRWHPSRAPPDGPASGDEIGREASRYRPRRGCTGLGFGPRRRVRWSAKAGGGGRGWGLGEERARAAHGSTGIGNEEKKKKILQSCIRLRTPIPLHASIESAASPEELTY